MSDPTPILCQGTTMTFNSQDVGGLMSITGIGSGATSDIDVTTFASPCKTFVPGLRDFGTVSIQLRRNEADVGQAAMFAALGTQSVETVVITLSNSQTITFNAYVKSLSVDLKANGSAEGKADLRIVTVPVFS